MAKAHHSETSSTRKEKHSATVLNKNQPSAKLPKENNPSDQSFKKQKLTPPKAEETSVKSEKLKKEVKERKPGDDVDGNRSVASE